MAAVLRIVDCLLALQLLFVWWNLLGLRTPAELAKRERRRGGGLDDVHGHGHGRKEGPAGIGDPGASGEAGWAGHASTKRDFLAAQPAATLAPQLNAEMMPPGRDAAATQIGPDAETSLSAKVPVSVLIPARDEERNIEGCLASVLAQEGVAGLEVLVLDDGSTDRTAAIVRQIAGRDPRVRLLRGEPLPAGWTGKSFACHQLSQHARGERWLFLDADARMLPGGLAELLTGLEAAGGGLVTGFPHQETGSWLERLIVPLMAFTVACHLPIRAAIRSPDPKLVAAHGACLLLHRDTYRAIGGHAAFAGHLVDDMQLAAAVKRAGHPFRLADISRCVSMRMYHSADEVWRGFKKNIYAGVGRSGATLAFVLLLYHLLFALPVAAFIGSLWRPGWLGPAATDWLLGVFIKLAVDRKWRQSSLLAFALPLAVPLLALLAIDSWRTAAAGKRYEWKGRWYR